MFVQIISQLAWDGPLGGKSVPLLPLLVPAVRIQRGELYWSAGWTAPLPAVSQPQSAERILEDFIQLADASDKEILRFAKKWGPLGLCRAHGLPVYHERKDGQVGPCPPRLKVDQEHSRKLDASNRAPMRLPDWPDELWSLDFDELGGHPSKFSTESLSAIIESAEFCEPIAKWKEYSRHARYLLALATELKAGASGNRVHWKTVLGRDPLPEEDRMALLVSGVNVWMALGRPRPIVTIGADGRPALWFVSGTIFDRLAPDRQTKLASQLGWSGGLFAVLAVRIASAVSGGGGMIACSACGTLYSPTRSPVLGRDHFCRNCGKKAAWKLAKRRMRGKR